MNDNVFMLAGMPDRGLGAKEFIIGVDEAGRGPLAGPVVAAAVILCRPCITGLDDSKKLTAAQRGALEPRIRRRCAYGIGVVDVEAIDRMNIFQATMWAMTIAVLRLVERLGREPDGVLVDGNLTPHHRHPDWRWPARAIVGGDASERAISAASILAKEHRDRLMCEYHLTDPRYGWERNKGYGTPEHLVALREHGATPHHRKSFSPVAQMALI